MKLYGVTVQDVTECTGTNLMYEVVVAADEEKAFENALVKIEDAYIKGNVDFNKDYFTPSQIEEINNIDGYKIIITRWKYAYRRFNWNRSYIIGN